jgi:hypothetical protein
MVRSDPHFGEEVVWLVEKHFNFHVCLIQIVHVSQAHGPRSPTTHFYMLPFYSRVLGLTSTLSIKLAQDDFHIVQDLEIPTEDPEYITKLMEQRQWGSSVLLVDK